MSKFFIFFLIGIIFSSCSLNKNSKFWTSTKDIDLENPQFKKILDDEKILDKTFNQNLKIKLSKEVSKDNKKSLQTNDDGRINFNGTLEKTSRYKFSKIKNFYQFEPVISFDDQNVIFFDNKGSILKFNDKSKLIWKKNYYSKSEKKLKPILQFANDKIVLKAGNRALLTTEINNTAPHEVTINDGANNVDFVAKLVLQFLDLLLALSKRAIQAFAVGEVS